jgi:hypothetical protein
MATEPDLGFRRRGETVHNLGRDRSGDVGRPLGVPVHRSAGRLSPTRPGCLRGHLAEPVAAASLWSRERTCERGIALGPPGIRGPTGMQPGGHRRPRAEHAAAPHDTRHRVDRRHLDGPRGREHMGDAVPSESRQRQTERDRCHEQPRLEPWGGRGPTSCDRVHGVILGRVEGEGSRSKVGQEAAGSAEVPVSRRL